MKQVLNLTIEAGSRESHEPRLIGSIVDEMLQGWNRNSELCVDLKTILHSDRRLQYGKAYPGMLRRDWAYHYTFTETLPAIVGKRNPHVFRGRYITVTRRDDGSLRPNFRPMPIGKDFSLDAYAIGVCNELRLALRGLVKEK
jgi:hypothetical protein